MGITWHEGRSLMVIECLRCQGKACAHEDTWDLAGGGGGTFVGAKPKDGDKAIRTFFLALFGGSSPVPRWGPKTIFYHVPKRFALGEEGGVCSANCSAITVGKNGTPKVYTFLHHLGAAGETFWGSESLLSTFPSC